MLSASVLMWFTRSPTGVADFALRVSRSAWR